MTRTIGILTAVLLLAACASRATPPSQDQLAADGLLQQGQYREALRLYSKASYSRDEEASYRALIGIATCHAHLGDSARFEAYAIEASSAAPNRLAAHRRLGRMYIAGAERFRAEPSGQRYARIGVEYLRRVFFSRNDSPNVAHNLGLGLYLLGDLGAAAVILEEAHRQTPARDDTLHLLLAVLRDLGHHERVRALLAERADARGGLPPSMQNYRNWATGRAKATPSEPTDDPEIDAP